jgi:diguanylate cyclase (GGDEF)-like protein/PAS domain S-box-containing protein
MEVNWAQWLGTSGEMPDLIRSMDWSATVLGPVASWPQSLRIATSLCLDSRFPMFIAWGPHQSMLYNDAYTAVLADKHPAALGRPVREVWAEIWHVLEPLWRRVINDGEATWSEDLLLVMSRSGYDEETYFTFSYSPIRDDHGQVKGMLCACQETTEKVVGQRRLHTLRELSAQLGRGTSVEGACVTAMRILADNPFDIPFAMLYLVEDDRKKARLMATAGMQSGEAASPEWVDLAAGEGDAGWPLAEVLRSGQGQLVGGLPPGLGRMPAGWPQAVTRQVIVLPVSGSAHEATAGVLVAGVSPVRPMDEGCRTFFDLAAGQIASSLVAVRTYEEQKKRAEALAEIDRAKTVFFSNVSHEFRTPLTLMLGPIEALLARPDELPKAGAEQLEIVYRNSLRLLKLVNALLDFSRIEAGRVQVSYQPHDLAALTVNLASSFRSAIELAGMQFVVDCRPLPEPVFVDREMWETIVLNLLSNAFKFTWQGKIQVRLKRSRGRVKLCVGDTGTGIPKDELPRLFERFHRAKSVQGRSYEGSGIGLALVRDLVQLHGGSIAVRSAVDKGTVFLLSLPLGKAHLPPDRVGVGQPEPATSRAAAYAEEALRWLPEAPSIRAPHDDVANLFGSATNHALPGVSGARILLADDNADMRQYLRQLLAPNCTIEAVADGVTALAAALRQPPDLVLSDVMMPRMGGIELLRQLRMDEKTRDIPVILLSALAGQDAQVEGIAAGADDYLVKPFSARELIARVETQIKLARIRREALLHEQALQAEKADLLESIIDPFLAIDAHWQMTYVNAAAEQLNAVQREDLLRRSFWEVFPATCGTIFERECRRVMEERVSARFEYYYEPYERWFEIVVFPVASGDIGVYARDVTERKKMEEEIRHQAHHDALTGLPNRRLFMEILDHELAHARRVERKCAVFLLDLDKFKFVNDTLGHHIGDLLLREVACRLRSSVRESDAVARMGGDEFNVLVHDIQDPADVVPVARKILQSFSTPVLLLEHELHLSTSIGISICPDDAVDPEALFAEADVAMYHAKAQGGNNYQFYNADMNIRTFERLRLENWLRQSLNHDELVVHYQPQLSIASGEIVAVEALVRWQHPERGLLDPLEFIPLAEETGFITFIDDWVLRTACRQLRQWQKTGTCLFKVTVNLSAKEFGQHDFIERVSRILAESDLDPQTLVIEITESVAMARPEVSIYHMNYLANLGIDIAVDDFGTGYSSLSYLKKLPISKLKIDKSFIKDIATDPDDRAIITAVTAMAQKMKLLVIAEGVETEDQLEFLRGAGCDEMQGYLFSRPLSAEEFSQRILART